MRLDEVVDTDVAKPKADLQVQKPKQFMCILHNDDYTDGEALITLIAKQFKHDSQTAMQIVIRAHEDGQCPCGGPYSRDEAETRAHGAMEAAEMHPMIGGGPAPLQISVEEITH